MIKIVNGVTCNFANSIDDVPTCNDYFFINEKILPKGISVRNIEDIIGRVADFIDSFDNQIPHGLSLFEYRFGVRFSNETPVRIYGHKTISSIKKELIDLLLEKLNSLNEEEYQNFKESYEDLIDDINKAVTTDDLMELASQIAEMLVDRHDDEYENSGKNQYEDLKEMVIDIIQSCAFESPVLGNFNYVSKWKGSLSNSDFLEIVLYVNNIYNAKDNYGGLLNAFEAVIAHEMFHYYHFCKTEISYYDYKCNDNMYIPWEFSQRNDYLSSVVKESFASYFEWMYCTENNISNDVSSSWYKYSINVYPYSGARCISDKNYFTHLVNSSLENGMNHVLFEMLDDIKKYYQIINHKFIVYNKTMSNNSSATNKTNNAAKDYSKYIFEGNEYGKGRLVLAVVKKYVSEHPNISYNELANIFKPELHKAKNGRGVIALQNEVSDKDKGIGANSHRRYFVNDEIVLKDGSIVLVTTEWGSGNIDPFLDYARNVLKYKIENKVPNTFTNDVLFDYNKINTIGFIPFPLRNRDTFAEVLEDIQNKKGLSKSQVCKRCCIDKTQYNRLLGARMDFPSRPAKETVYKICIGLELGYEEAMKLIEIAGYCKTDYLDDLIEHCLKYSYYNKDEIDSTLKQNNYKTLFNTDTFDDYYEKNKNKIIDITKE